MEINCNNIINLFPIEKIVIRVPPARPEESLGRLTVDA
jgi:hypothetical protein